MTTLLEDRGLTDSDLLALLERDYRRQLRWYPAPWRAVHGEALIGTLLDEADDTDRFTMEPGEWRSFAAAGVASRLDRIVPRPVRDAAATALLSAGVGVSLASSVISSWAPWSTEAEGHVRAFGPFFDAGPVLAALWAVALIAGTAGRWWIGRIALLLSVLAAALMHPLEALTAPVQFVSLDAGTLTLSATAALLAAMGTPRARPALVAASAGWAGLACIAYGYQLLTGSGPTDGPTGFLFADAARSSWTIALALAVAAVFALARFRVVASTVLLCAVPLTAGLEASRLAFEWGDPPASFALIPVPVALGLIALVTASHRATGFRNGAIGRTAGRGRTRRSIWAVVVATPLVVLGGTAGAFTASGLDWTNPTGVNWSEYWQKTASRPWPDFARHPDASVAYALPSGGRCTVRIAITDLTTTGSPTPAAVAADAYLHAGVAHDTLLADADVPDVIRSNPSARNRWTNFWGASVRYGAGTSSYNPDVEYFEAVDAGLRKAVLDHVRDVGASPDDIAVSSAQRCTGEQR